MIDAHTRLTRPMGSGPLARFAAALGAVLIAATALMLVPASPAAAHSELIDSSPTDGEQLTSAPDSLRLEFNENIQDLGTEVVVTLAGTDASAVDGDPVVDGPAVEVPLAVTEPGAYDVVWRVVSADGHPISGRLGFDVETVEAATTAESTTSEPTTSEPTTAEPTTESTSEDTEATTSAATTDEAEATDDGSDPAPIVIGVIAAVVVVVAAVLLVRHRLARRERP